MKKLWLYQSYKFLWHWSDSCEVLLWDPSPWYNIRSKSLLTIMCCAW